MSSKFSSFLAEDRRLVLLRVLADIPAYRANSYVLNTLLAQWGHSTSADQVKTDIRWLEEQGLLAVEAAESVLIATLTERGADVAAGRAVVPGVKRPGA